jgi:GxxExxY protein
MESAYEECLCFELSKLRVRFQRQVPLPINYKGLKLDCAYKKDLLIEDQVIVELKAIDDLRPVHSAQLLTYLKASGKQVGLLINFNEPVLRKGLKRIANGYVSREATAHVTSASSARQPAPNAEAPKLSETLRSSLRLGVSAVKANPAVKERSH